MQREPGNVIADLIHYGIGKHDQRVASIVDNRAECCVKFAEIAGRKTRRCIREIRKLDPELDGHSLRSLPL